LNYALFGSARFTADFFSKYYIKYSLILLHLEELLYLSSIIFRTLYHLINIVNTVALLVLSLGVFIAVLFVMVLFVSTR